MRATRWRLTTVCGMMLCAAAAQAAPHAPAGAAAVRPIRLAAGGCGPGFHPRTYRGPYGRLYTECVPNAAVVPVPAPVPVRRCAPGWHWREWRGPSGRLRAECVPNR